MKDSSRIHAVMVAALLLLPAVGAFAQPTFINRIPIPRLLDASDGPIHLEMQMTTHKFNPANPSDSLNGGMNQPNGIQTYTYNLADNSSMTILGPTLKWHTLENTTITVTNMIGDSSTTHWHGAEVPPGMDGGPHQGIPPGGTWPVNFTTLDSACTMWYHPHFHDRTLEHVQKGLSGMIIIEQEGDPIRATLPHTYGVDDIPVIIGDIGFTSSSSSAAGMVIDTVNGHRPINIVNGVTNPYLEVPAHLVRLRILNGSTRKGIIFGVSNSYTDPFSSLKPFYLIATDGGYTLKPNTLRSTLNGPGERDEIILDLSSYAPGDTLYLSNLKDSLPNFVVGSPHAPPGGLGHGRDSTIGSAFLQLRIVADNTFPNYTPVTTFTPFTTTWSPGLADTSNVVRHRLKRLVSQGAGKGFTIDGSTFDMHMLNDTVCVNTKEIWTIHNVSGIAHPFHIHKIQFRVLDVTDSNGNRIDLEAHGLNGPKDDVLVYPGWKLRFLGQFDDYPTPIDHMNAYMYHCHILTHEDALGGGMMHQFVVTNEGPCLISTVMKTEDDRPAMELISNPATGTLYLKGESAMPGIVTIFDLQGRRIRGEQLQAFDGNAMIDIDGLPGGLYLVEWRTDRGAMTGRVVVLR